MAFKRQIDRLPIPPRDARVTNAVCHFCIVGCGYKAYTWDVNRQGGPAPAENAFGQDLRQQQATESAAWYSPSMYNIVRQDGRDVHIVLKPDHDCVVNSGLGSIRGARMAEMLPSPVTGTSRARLAGPAMAQANPAGVPWSALSPGNDWTAQLIQSIFPVPGAAGATGGGAIGPEATVIGGMLGQLTGAVMVFMLAYLCYGLIQQSVAAAETARVLGNRTNAWLPVRLAFA